MSIEVKILGAGDEGVLDRVADDVFDDPIVAATSREFLADRRHRLAVALDDGIVVGFVSAVLYVHPDKPRPELWINEVGVAGTHQGRGLGRALLEAMLENARELDCREAWVLTDRSNAPAMGLYAVVGGEIAPGDTVMFTFFLDRDRRHGDPDRAARQPAD
jgi:aminoglycoside 6'-N-acetyltransferase I